MCFGRAAAEFGMSWEQIERIVGAAASRRGLDYARARYGGQRAALLMVKERIRQEVGEQIGSGAGG
jgi:hypothetical protein